MITYPTPEVYNYIEKQQINCRQKQKDQHFLQKSNRILTRQKGMGWNVTLN